MSKYRRVTYADRCLLQALLDTGKSVRVVARRVGVHKSTIYREIKRNSSKKGYNSLHADTLYLLRKNVCRRPYKIRGRLKARVLAKLRQNWSPKQIEQRLMLERRQSVSHESIYRFLERDRACGGNLFKLLRRQTRVRRRRFPRLPRHSLADYYRNIADRPKAAEMRLERGHWERDTMFGKSRTSSLLVMVDRKTRFCRLLKLKTKMSDEVLERTVQVIVETGRFRSITSDNGPEMRSPRLMSWAQKRMFYCDPYQPNQRGTVENTIGLLRQYIPKRADFSKINHRQIKLIERRLNNRPRKVLDYRTPAELFFEKPVALAT